MTCSILGFEPHIRRTARAKLCHASVGGVRAKYGYAAPSESAELVDDGETDWKLLVVDVDAADAPSWRDVSDIPEARVSEARG